MIVYGVTRHDCTCVCVQLGLLKELFCTACLVVTSVNGFNRLALYKLGSCSFALQCTES